MKSANKMIATLPVRDQNRADNFYKDVLGFKSTDNDMPGGTQLTGPGGGELFLYVTEATSGTATSLSFNVSDFDEVAKTLSDSGVEFEVYENIPGVTDTKGVYKIGESTAAWFKDTEGNIINIFSSNLASE